VSFQRSISEKHATMRVSYSIAIFKKEKTVVVVLLQENWSN